MNCQKLREKLRTYKRVAVALSGGLDSSALLAVCADMLGVQNCLALTAKGAHMMRAEIDDAKNLCENLGVKFLSIDCEIPSILRNNPPDRCYICKREIFTKFKDEAFKLGFEILVDGTNFDDLSDYRPGMKALKELGVISPFLDCEIGKDEIREIAQNYNLKVAKKPAYACLLTRFEHGANVSKEDLQRVDGAEEFLRGLSFNSVRVRVHSYVARIEIPREKFADFLMRSEEISKHLKVFGFSHVALDINGYMRGSMNENG